MAWTDLTIPPAPVLNGVGTGAAERQLSAAGSRSVVPLVYGEDRIAGLVLNVLPAAAGSATLLVQLLWCFACDSVSALKLNDQDLPTGSSVTHYTGNQTTPDASLVAAFASQGITYTAALTGYAYSVVSVPIRSIGSAEFNFAAIIRGRKVYDPRKDSTAGGVGSHRFTAPSTWEWSDNPTLCLADYSSSIVYGAGTPIDWTTVPAAANANDALVGGEARRIVGVSFIKAVEAAEAIETLRAYAGCWVLPGVNGVRLVPDADAASCASYGHAAGDIAAIQPLTLRDTSRAPTVVEVIYTDRSKLPWRDASAIAQLPGAGATKPWRLSQVRLPGVARYSQALREATERLNKLTLCDLSTSVEIYDIGIRHEIGDIILLSHPLGLDAKAFRVVTPRRTGPGRWQLDVVEHDSAVYSNEVVTAPTVADTSWVSPAGPPAAVTGFTAVPDELGVLLRWDKAPEKDVIGYELRIGGTSWETALPLAGGIKTVAAGNSYRWLQPASGTYTLRIKALDSEGMASTTATVLTPTVTTTKLAGIQAGATVGAQWGVNINGQPSDDAIRNNLIDLGWWKGGASIPWPLNQEVNTLYSTAEISGTIGGPKGVHDVVWYCRESAGDGQSGGGWDAVNTLTLDPSKTYRFVLPIFKRDGVGGTAYWGVQSNTVCINNTSTLAENPYFAYVSRDLMLSDRWYLFVGYVYPQGSTGNSNDGAGVWDCKTGTKFSDGWNYCHAPGGAKGHRAYQYYAGLGSTQLFGRPMVNVVDGTEPSLRECFAASAVLNSAQQWSDVQGPGRPEDSATQNRTYSQDSDPGAVSDGSIWITSTRSYQRWAGAWRPYVGPGSVGTDLITPGAATTLVEKFMASVEVTGLSFSSNRDSYAVSYSPIGFIAFTPDYTGVANIFVSGVLEIIGTATFFTAGVDRQITAINADINGDGIAQPEDNLAYLDQAQYVEAGMRSSFSSHFAGRLQVAVSAGVPKTVWLYGQKLGIGSATHTLKNIRLGLEGVKR